MTRQWLMTLLLTFSMVSMAQTKLYLKGNIVPGGSIELTQQSDQLWQSEVDLDDSSVFLFENKYVYFESTDPTYKTSNIRINGGHYTVTFNMADKQWDFQSPVDNYRISAFGSSVCNGHGATDNKGYAWLYGEMLKERTANDETANPFYVSGIAVGGNTTQMLLDRYGDLIRDHSRYVLIGLSLGNEGIHESDNKENTMNQFAQNMQTLITKMRADGKVPVVMNNYTRADFTADDYTYIKKLNLLIHQWDVPSLSTLGAIDDGAGHWATGHQADGAHPNTTGHKEIFYAMTPSLFDALESGKELPAARDLSRQMTLSDGNTIVFTGEGTIHPFTVSVRVKGRMEGQLFSLESGSRTATVAVDTDGHVVYKSPTNRRLTTVGELSADDWHLVTLTHYYAQGRVLLYIDGESAGEVRERLTLGDVTLGDTDPATSRGFSELMFWRGGLSPEEVQAVAEGKLLKSSLEFYVPMDSPSSLLNLAMSLNSVKYVPGSASSVLTPSATRKSAVTAYNLLGQAIDSQFKGIVVINDKKYYNK